MALVIYRAIFGDYDKIPLSLPKNLRSDIRCLLLTDTPIASEDWEVIEIDTQDPVLANRHCKMFPWEYFEADKSLYLDGHIEFGDDFADFLDDLCQSNDDFSALRHREVAWSSRPAAALQRSRRGMEHGVARRCIKRAGAGGVYM